MFIVVSADIGLVLSMMGLEKSFSTAVTILRAFRILRIVKLLQKYESIREIIMTVINILPSVSKLFRFMFVPFKCRRRYVIFKCTFQMYLSLGRIKQIYVVFRCVDST